MRNATSSSSPVFLSTRTPHYALGRGSLNHSRLCLPEVGRLPWEARAWLGPRAKPARGRTGADRRGGTGAHIGDGEVLEHRVAGVSGKTDEPQPDTIGLADVGTSISHGVEHGPQRRGMAEGVDLRRGHSG